MSLNAEKYLISCDEDQQEIEVDGRIILEWILGK
jgi:hypothetical protein